MLSSWQFLEYWTVTEFVWELQLYYVVLFVYVYVCLLCTVQMYTKNWLKLKKVISSYISFRDLRWNLLQFYVHIQPFWMCWNSRGSQQNHGNGNGISSKEYFRRITAWYGEGISPRWMLAEDHNSTINW